MTEIFGVDSRVLYTALIALVIVERLVELRFSSRNIRRLKSQGAIEVGSEHYPAMVVMHTLFLISAPLEVWFLARSFILPLALSMLVLLGGAMTLRFWVIGTLEGRWTTRVICLPGAPLVATGPYKFMRHPNYLAVVIETFALPMVHTAWMTASLFSLANAFVLRKRIGVEDKALQRYSAVFEDGSRSDSGDDRA